MVGQILILFLKSIDEIPTVKL